jgi:hypothetical protein
MMEQIMAMRKRQQEEVVFPNVAGIDAGNSSHPDAVPPQAAEMPVRVFGAMRTCGRFLYQEG